MKNKGFTLIELLAVIVILAIIALIATPIVMDSISTAKKGAAKDAGYGYIKAVEYSIAAAAVNTGATAPTTLILDHTSILLKGTRPTSVSLILSNGVVTTGYLTVNGYVLTVTATGSITTP